MMAAAAVSSRCRNYQQRQHPFTTAAAWLSSQTTTTTTTTTTSQRGRRGRSGSENNGGCCATSNTNRIIGRSYPPQHLYHQYHHHPGSSLRPGFSYPSPSSFSAQASGTNGECPTQKTTASKFQPQPPPPQQHQRRFWSLNDLATVNKWDHPEMQHVIDDIAFRLQYQSTMLERLSDCVETMRGEPLPVLADCYYDSSSSSFSRRSANVHHHHEDDDDDDDEAKKTTRMPRPYWWTHRKESQLQQEIETQRGQVRNLQRLYTDTYHKIRQFQEYRNGRNAPVHGTTTPQPQPKQRRQRRSEEQEQEQKGKERERHLLFKLFGEIYSRHALTMETFAEMVIALRPLHQSRSMGTIIDRLLHERLGMLLLCDHVTVLSNEKKNPPAVGGGSSSRKQKEPLEDVEAGTAGTAGTAAKAKAAAVGAASSSPIAVDVDIADEVSRAVTEASHLCEAHYLVSPRVNVNVIENHHPDETASTTIYTSGTIDAHSIGNNNNPHSHRLHIVKSWFQYTLVELLKNSMSVTVENRKMSGFCAADDTVSSSPASPVPDEDERDHDKLRPIHIYIYETASLVTIEIHDQGGGIGGEDDEGTKFQEVFDFAQRRKKWDRMDDQQTYAMTRSPLRGLGVGLCASRMMMEYFGGTLELVASTTDQRDRLAAYAVNDCDYDDFESGVIATITLPKDSTIPEKISYL